MKKLLLVLAVLGAVGTALAVARGPSPDAGTASSHREAPLISEDPTADNTDLYAFRSQDAPDMLTIIANWSPASDPAAGPNWWRFSPSARYNIYIDRQGDGDAEIAYRFRFRDRPGLFFLGNTVQDYRVTKDVMRDGKVMRSTVLANGTTPPNNIGPRVLGTFFGTTDYDALAAQNVFDLRGGGEVFAGQREDPFYADIGQIFDAVGFRKNLGNEGGGKDFFAGYGVQMIALQVEISDLRDKDKIVGVWASTERPEIRTKAPSRSNDFEQVSRLGNPLVNEVIIGTVDKDSWNASSPANEEKFVGYYRRPILANLFNVLYPGVVNAPETRRRDLVQVFLTGVPGLNRTGSDLAEVLRINLAIDPTAPVGEGNRLGVLAGDLAGWPNGRRLEDDVVDIAERAVAGVLLGNNVALGDGVDANNVPFKTTFPYVGATFSGADNTLGNCAGVREEVGDSADGTC